MLGIDYIAALDGSTYDPLGWLNHHWIQLAYQLADSVSGFGYSFGGSIIILFCLNYIPGMRLRLTEEDEILGADEGEVGEFAYDYVELTRDIVTGVTVDDGFPTNAGKRSVSSGSEKEGIDSRVYMQKFDGRRDSRD